MEENYIQLTQLIKRLAVWPPSRHYLRGKNKVSYQPHIDAARLRGSYPMLPK